MKALVLTDTWKANLSAGDYTKRFPPKVLLRAEESGYVVVVDEPPTMEDYKDDIRDYCDRNDIEYNESDTKQELIDKINDVD